MLVCVCGIQINNTMKTGITTNSNNFLVQAVLDAEGKRSATVKQTATLTKLGYTGDLSKLSLEDASKEIERLIAVHTERRKQALIELGYVGNIDALTQEEISDLTKKLWAAIRSEVESINQRVDLRDFVSGLRKVNAGENCGACPKCGGDDRFRVKKDSFFCRHCYFEGDKHFPVYLPIWLGRARTFREAIDFFGGSVASVTVPESTKPKAKESKSELTQDVIDERISEARLCLPESKPVIDYLAGRGIDLDTAVKFGLGAYKNGYGWAVVFPYSTATGNQSARLRALLPDKDGKRVFWSWGGGGGLFGEHLVKPANPYLFAQEGQTNAISTHLTGSCMGISAVCWGNNSLNDDTVDRLATIAQGREILFVWADDEADVKKVVSKLPAMRIVAIKSLYDGKKKLDANEYLQRGQLAGFLAAQLYIHGDRQRLYESLRIDPNVAPQVLKRLHAEGYTMPEPATIGDITDYVGQTVDGATWAAIQHKATGYGWTVSATQTGDKWHFRRLEAKPQPLIQETF